MLNQIQESPYTVDLEISQDYSAGDVVIDDKVVGIAINGGSSGDTISLLLVGIVELSADNSTAFTFGAAIYWDGSMAVLEGEGNTYIGTCVTAKSSSESVANIMLNGLNAPTDSSTAVSVATGSVTTTGGAATETITLDDVLSTDVAFAQISSTGSSAVTITTVVSAAGGIDITFSADPSSDHVISYDVKRAT